MSKRKSNKKIVNICLIVGLLVVGVCLQFLFKNPTAFWQNIFNTVSFTYSDSNFSSLDYDMTVHVLDVGKADAIYINCGNKNILIDSGDVDVTNTVYEYLRKMNVEKLDLVMVSHPHRDHIGGMTEIINGFTIEKFMMPCVPEDITPTNNTYLSMLQALSDKGILIDRPVAGESFEIGDISINIFGPLKQYNDLNNNSIVAQFIYGNDSFLFTGDASKDSEKDILSENFDIKSTVLKVAHHGSASSTTKKFLQAVNPDIAVISVGPDSNDLPKTSTIEKLDDNGTKVYRTDINGNVIFATNGDGVSVIIEKE